VNFLAKHKLKILFSLGIVILYFSLRLPNLTLQPIFVDEAIYIRWAQVMKSEPTLRFLPLSDGKTPLFMWAMMPVFKIFDDPLLAGRFLSVVSGFFSLLGVFLLSKKIFGIKIGFWAALIYTVSPFTIFFDRMALVDSMLAAFTIWSLYFTIWLLKSQRVDLAMILGYLLGGALLTKTPAMLNILVLPISLLGFNFKQKRSNLIKLLGMWLLAIAIALIIYNLLRLGPGFNQLSSRNQDYVFTPLEILSKPWDPFLPHLRDSLDYFLKLLTWPTLIFWVIGLFKIIKEKNRLGMVILLFGLLPMFIEMAFLKTFTARYILFSIPPLLIVAGVGIDKLIQELYRLKLQKGLTPLLPLLLLMFTTMSVNYLLLADPQKAPLPRYERVGYFEEWTAGYGFPEIAQFLIEEKKRGPVVVGTEGYFGTLPDGLQIYLDKAGIPIITGRGIISKELRESAKDNKTFFVANKNRLGDLPGTKLIKEYPKAKPLNGMPQDAIVVYQVFP